MGKVKKTLRERRIGKMLEKLQFIQGTLLYDPLTDDELSTVEKSLNEFYVVVDEIETKYFNPADGSLRSHPIEDDE